MNASGIGIGQCFETWRHYRGVGRMYVAALKSLVGEEVAEKVIQRYSEEIQEERTRGRLGVEPSTGRNCTGWCIVRCGCGGGSRAHVLREKAQVRNIPSWCRGETYSLYGTTLGIFTGGLSPKSTFSIEQGGTQFVWHWPSCNRLKSVPVIRSGL